jgi:hypothetical protein
MAPGARDWRHRFSERQRGGAAEAWEPRWGGGPAAAQTASPVGPRSEYVAGRTARPWLAAAGLAVKGRQGAYHTCGETGHHENGCPHPWCNGWGTSRQRGLGRTSGGGASGACFMCGQLGHQAAQCSKRVLPPAAAAGTVAPGIEATGSVDAESEIKAFQ